MCGDLNCINGGRAQILSIMGTEDLHRTAGLHFLDKTKPICKAYNNDFVSPIRLALLRAWGFMGYCSPLMPVTKQVQGEALPDPWCKARSFLG